MTEETGLPIELVFAIAGVFLIISSVMLFPYLVIPIGVIVVIIIVFMLGTTNKQ